MKLLMRPDTYRASTQEGVYFLTHQGPVTLTGPSVAQWVDRLAPHLNGTRSLDELTAHLDSARRAVVERLVTELVSAGVAREVPGPDAVDTPVDEAEERFLAHFLPDPKGVFARYRSGGALVLGPAALTEPVARACADSGIDRVAVTATDTAPPAPDKLAELVGEARIVVYAATEPDPETTRLLRELCAGDGSVLAHLYHSGADIWHGPVGPVTGTASWTSGRRRLDAAGYHPSSTAGGDHALQIAVAQMVQRAFRAAAGLTSPTEHTTLVRVDARTHASDHHTFLAHPFDTEPTPRNEARFHSTIAALRSGERLDEETVSRRTAPLVDDRTGVFVTFEEDAYTQSPLHVSALTVADPVNLLGNTGQRPTVLGFGTGFASARYHAAMLGYATYGSLMVDPRHLFEAAVEAGPDEAVRGLRAPGVGGLARGYRLADQQPCTVPAERAFPALAGAVPRSWPVTGSAAGYTWREAVEEALLAHCREIAVRRLADAAGPFPGVDLDDAHLDERGDRYRGMLEAIGIAPEVYDLSGLLGLPCYLFRVAEAPVSCAVGVSTTQALATGAHEVLRHFQASKYAHPQCAPPTSPDLPPALRGPRRPLEPRSGGVEALVAALRHAGASPIAIPLDHDPEVTRRMPYIVQVVLDHD